MTQFQHRLWHAVSTGDVKQVDAMARKKNVNFCVMIDDHPSFVLNVAVQRNCFALVNLLLVRGANPRIGPSPLLTAMRCKVSIAIVEVLLQHGADPNFLIQRCLNHEEDSLLYEFCKYPYRFFKDVGELLLKYGADPFFVRNDFKTCLYVAAQNGNVVAVDVLLDHAKSNGYLTDLLLQEKRDTRTSPLLKACTNQHVRIVEHLLENGANANAQNVYGMFPMYAAAFGNNMVLVKLLLRYDVYLPLINTQTRLTAVEVAFDYGFYEIALLLEHMLDLYNRAYNGELSVLTQVIFLEPARTFPMVWIKALSPAKKAELFEWLLLHDEGRSLIPLL